MIVHVSTRDISCLGELSSDMQARTIEPAIREVLEITPPMCVPRGPRVFCKLSSALCVRRALAFASVNVSQIKLASGVTK